MCVHRVWGPEASGGGQIKVFYFLVILVNYGNIIFKMGIIFFIKYKRDYLLSEVRVKIALVLTGSTLETIIIIF